MSFKTAVIEWEALLGETMVGYSTLTRKACTSPDKIFAIVYWDIDMGSNCYRTFDVGLEKIKGRWVVNRLKFNTAIIEKIKTVEDYIRLGKTQVTIQYPTS
jgi:hypothetical protein